MHLKSYLCHIAEARHTSEAYISITFPSFAAYFLSDFKVLWLNIIIDDNFYLQNI